MTFKNKKVLITGASGGIGTEFIHQLLKDGATVYAVTRKAGSGLDSIAKLSEGRLKILVGDVTREAELARLKEEVEASTPSLNLIINNAGTYLDNDSDFEELPPQILRDTFEVNTIAPMMVAKNFLPLLQKAAKTPEGATLVNITSLMGSIDDNESGGSYAYRMSKAALNMFTKSFSIDLPEIITLCLHPGWVQTKMGGASAPTSPETSVSGMLSVISGAKKSESGHFFDFEGDPVHW
jgi:NAD(P)-dependent dehydrogenase (short-subunit alcohol dehydrogenase family)